MTLAVPTTKTVSDSIVAQLAASISQSIPLLPKAFSRVLAKALAGLFVLLYKYCGFIFLQLFVQHASMEETTINGVVIRPLVWLGRLFGAGDPNPAEQAELVIDVTVTNETGTLSAGEQLLRAATGIVYTTKYAVALDAPTVQVTIVASSDQDDGDGSGSIGNLVADDVVTFANPLANVDRDATVSSVAVSGADEETPEAYRARVLRKVQQRPQGGAYADYPDWAFDVAGIIHVYPYTSDTPGEVDVYCEATEASSGSADGFPTGAQLTAVADAIELNVSGKASRRPANAAVNVLSITREAFDVTIYGLTVDDEATVKSDLSDGLDEYLRSREPFILGLSVLPRDDRITQAAVGGIVDGIVSAAGGTVSKVELSKDSVNLTAHTLDKGAKAKLGTASYV